MSQQPSASTCAWAGGVSVFAGAALLTVGLFQFLQGLAAVAEDDVFVAGVDYVYSFDLTTWGLIHLGLGLVVAIVGGAILAGQSWAYLVGIMPAILSSRPTSCGCPTTHSGRC